MNNNIDSKPNDNDIPIDFLEIWIVIWKQKIIVIAFILFFTVGSAIYALNENDIYRSAALLVPAEANQPQNPLLAQLGQAAGLSAIANNSGTIGQINTAIAIIQSREFAREFISKRNLKPLLLSDCFEPAQDIIGCGAENYDYEAEVWLGNEPSDQDAIDIFQSALSVTKDPATNMVTVAIEWTDPRLAESWVSQIVEEINKQIKEQDLNEAYSAITFLQSQLETTQLIEMQRAFYQLIESQTRIVMLADVREDYVFRVVDPAYVPEKKIRPSRSIIVMAGALIGALFSFLFVGVIYVIRERN